MSLTFRTRPEQGSTKRYATEVLNALNENLGAVYIVGNVLTDADYPAFVAQYATDKGTTVVRHTNATPSAFRQAVKTMAANLKRQVSFLPEQAFIDDRWVIVGYKTIVPQV